MPATVDFVLAGLIGVAYPIVDQAWSWPRMRRAILGGARDARRFVYLEIIATTWGLTLAVAAARVARHLPWRDVGIAAPGGWWLAVTATLVAALALLAQAQRRAIGRLTDEARRRVLSRMGEVELLAPRTPSERVGFVVVSVTAGICEEFIYRGFLIWALMPWLGVWAAAIVSLASFVSAHAYQGRAKLPQVAVAGAMLTLIALFMHSVLPGMVLHAMIDVVSGEAGYALAMPREADVAGHREQTVPGSGA